jgi:hypothetical protein
LKRDCWISAASWNYKPDLVTVKDIQRVHFCVPDPWAVTTESHFISAGGAKTIGMAVVDGRGPARFCTGAAPRASCQCALCTGRPRVLQHQHRSGHGGISAERPTAYDRVAIVDTDCHHGDGTQDIYWHDPGDAVHLACTRTAGRSTRDQASSTKPGGPTAAGTTLNIPLPPIHSGGGLSLYAVDQIVVLPILDDFQPDSVIVNSAGQDNHYSDPITNMNFSAQGIRRPHPNCLDARISPCWRADTPSKGPCPM